MIKLNVHLDLSKSIGCLKYFSCGGQWKVLVVFDDVYEGQDKRHSVAAVNYYGVSEQKQK